MLLRYVCIALAFLVLGFGAGVMLSEVMGTVVVDVWDKMESSSSAHGCKRFMCICDPKSRDRRKGKQSI